MYSRSVSSAYTGKVEIDNTVEAVPTDTQGCS